MNTAAFRRLFWKEYRQQRAFWLASALIILMILGLASVAESSIQDKADDFFYLFVVVGLSVFYALGCGAMLFAGEHEENTFEFQRNLPVSAGWVFLPKVVFAIFATVSLICALSIPAGLLDYFHGHQFNIPQSIPWYGWLLGALYFGYILSLALLWGMLFSLLIKRVLLATFLGAVVGIACSLGGRVLLAATFDKGVDHNIVLKIIFFSGDFILLILANILLGRRWFNTRSSRIASLAAKCGFDESALDAASSENMEEPRTAIILRRLVWQQWRFSRLLMGVYSLGFGAIFLLLTILYLISPQFNPERERDVLLYEITVYSLFFSGCLIALFGSSVFHGDQRLHSVRYLAQRAASPRHVWLSRQIVWTAPIFLVWLVVFVYCLLACIYSMFEYMPFVAGQFMWLQTMWGITCHFWCYAILQPVGWLAVVAIIFAAGQLCSMLFRSGLLAAVFGLVLSGFCAAWVALMMWLGASPIWSVLSLAVGMFAATWIFTPDWMRERAGWRKYLRPATAVFAPLLAVSIILLVYILLCRVYSIPLSPSPRNPFYLFSPFFA